MLRLARWHAAEGHHSYANQWRMTYRLMGNADMQTTIDHYVDFLKVGSVRPL